MARSQGRDKTRPAIPDAYTQVHTAFRWAVPERFNMAQVCMRRWADSRRTAAQLAVLSDSPGQPVRRHTYAQLQDEANRLSNALRLLGVRAGDRVAIVLPQRFETAVAYMAVLQLGAVAMPLSQLFGPEALEYRLQDSAAVVALCLSRPAQPASAPSTCASRNRPDGGLNRVSNSASSPSSFWAQKSTFSQSMYSRISAVSAAVSDG